MKTLFIKVLVAVFMFFLHGLVEANSDTTPDIQQILAELGYLPKNKLKMNHEELDANQNYSEISPHQSGQNGYPQKNPQTTNAGECVERREPS